MDKTKNCNQPAFGHVAMSERDGFHEPGLTKREYLAALAMQGLLTRLPNRQNGETDLGILECKRIAEESTIMADELLSALEKEV